MRYAVSGVIKRSFGFAGTHGAFASWSDQANAPGRAMDSRVCLKEFGTPVSSYRPRNCCLQLPMINSVSHDQQRDPTGSTIHTVP